MRTGRLLMMAMVVFPASGWCVSVTPPRTEVRLLPGGSQKAVITIANPDPVPYDVEVTEKLWQTGGDMSTIPLADWLHLPHKTHFRLKPGKSQDVTITVQCPKDAVGELMGMVSFTYVGDKVSMITPMISTAVYLRVAGTEKSGAEVLALGAGTRNNQFVVGIRLKATGNVRLRPTGTIRLLDDSGKEVAVYTVRQSHPIFPGTNKEFGADGPGAPPPAGHYQLSADLISEALEIRAERGFRVGADGVVQMDPVAASAPVSKGSPKS